MDASMVVFVTILTILVFLLIVFIIVVYLFVPGERSGYKGYFYPKSAATEEVLHPLRERRATIDARPPSPHYPRPLRERFFTPKDEEPRRK